MNARILKTFPVALAFCLAISGCKRNSEVTITPSNPNANASPGAKIVSAETTSFDEVTSKLDPGGSFYMYASTEEVLGHLSASVAQLSNVVSSLPAGDNPDNVARGFAIVNSLVQKSGLEQINGFGASSIAREKGLYFSKAILYHKSGEDSGLIWTMFGKESHPLKELDMLPENTIFATYGDFDVTQLWNTITNELAELRLPNIDESLARFPSMFEAQVGFKLDDLLNSLGGGSGFILTANEAKYVTLPIPGAPMEIPEPGIAIYLKVKSDFLYDQAIQKLSANPSIAGMMSRSDVNGVKSHTVTIPIPLPFDVSPTLARSGDYLILTSSKALLDEILAVQAGKKTGFTSTDEFKRLSQGIPKEGNHFSLISERFGKITASVMSSIVTNKTTMLSSQSTMLHNMMETNARGASFAVAANGPDGWEVMANGTKSMNAMILPAAIGAVAVGTAIALPAMARARAQAQNQAQNGGGGGSYNMVMNNLRQVDSAKEQFALERAKVDGSAVSMDDLNPYLGPGFRAVAGETYIPNPIGVAPQARLGISMNGHAAGTKVSLASP